MAVLTRVPDVETGCPPSAGLTRSWMEAATRVHAILTQSVPDELLDTISAGDAAHRTPFKVPALLVG